MRFLIIEDDQNKSAQLSNFLNENFYECSTYVAKSYQSGLKEIMTNHYDVVLLDMQLPTFDISSGEDGYIFRTMAGIDILKELQRKKRTVSIIVVTQFERFGEGDDSVDLSDLKRIMSENFTDNYKGTVYYNPAHIAWKENLKSLIKKISTHG